MAEKLDERSKALYFNEVAIPFYETFTKIFEGQEVEGKEECIRYFLTNDSIPNTILDIGTGGGFPSIPIALEYPEIQVTGIDSIQKKINAISNIAKELQIKNIEFIRDRVENIKDKKYDMITSRAVAQASLLIEYAYPLLKKDGYLVLYKSKNVDEEIEKAKPLIRKLHMKISDIIEYSLPLEENYNRCLLVLQK